MDIISITTGPLIHGRKLAPFSLPTRRNLRPLHKNTFFHIRVAGSPTFSTVQTRVTARFPSTHTHDSPRTCGAPAIIKSAALLAAAAALLAARLAKPPLAIAATAAAPPPTVKQLVGEVEAGAKLSPSDLSQFLQSNSEASDELRMLIYQKLELGEDAESLRILERLMVARPDEIEWKFFAGRLLNEMGRLADARKMFDEILEKDPLSFEALFENAVLMDRCGERDAAMERLRMALEVAREERKEEKARDVRLIMAQMQYLQKKVDEALRSYEELAKEDPMDYRPYFCQGVIYTLMDRNMEAREKFAKYKELSPKKFEVEGFVQTPLSRMKLFGTGDSDN